METVRSFCRVCTAVCGILVDVDGDEVRRVRGDADHPFSKGYICPKGRALGQVHHHPDRSNGPWMRVAAACRTHHLECVPRRPGRAAAATSSTARTSIDRRLLRQRRRHGRRRLPNGRSLTRAIGTTATFSPLTIDGTAKPLRVAPGGWLHGARPARRPRHADFGGLVGVNPVVSHGHAISMPTRIRHRDPRLANPRHVWVIDPRRTETARLATRHLAARPGTDDAVLAYLVRELLRDGCRSGVLEPAPIDARPWPPRSSRSHSSTTAGSPT